MGWAKAELFIYDKAFPRSWQEVAWFPGLWMPITSASSRQEENSNFMHALKSRPIVFGFEEVLENLFPMRLIRCRARGSVRALSLYRVCKALCYLRVVYILNYQVLSGIPERELSLRGRALRSGSVLGVGMRARRKAAFLLLSIPSLYFINSRQNSSRVGRMRPLSLFYSDASADGVEEIARPALSLARSAQAERDNESCFFVRAASVPRFIRSDIRGKKIRIRICVRYFSADILRIIIIIRSVFVSTAEHDLSNLPANIGFGLHSPGQAGNLGRNSGSFQISYQEGGGPSSESRLICDDCIASLRDSYNFKKMVLHSEETFKERLQRLRRPPEETTVEVKQETYQLEDLEDGSSEDFNVGNINDDENIVDDSLSNIKIEHCKTEPMNFTSEEEAELVIEEEPIRKRRIQRRKVYRTEEGQVVTRKSKSAKGIVQDFQQSIEPSCSEPAPKGRKRGADVAEPETGKRSRSPETVKIKKMKENTLKLIKYSNLTIFFRTKSKYKCFHCQLCYADMRELKTHTSTHEIAARKKIMHLRNLNLLKADISGLECKICATSCNDLDSLLDHLKVHKIKFEGVDYLLMPFRLGDGPLACVFCDRSFGCFKKLQIHMHDHYKNHVCDVCGRSFANVANLRHHVRNLHRPVRCRDCGVTLNNISEKNTHRAKVHNVKFNRYYCHVCCEVSTNAYAKLLHMNKVHGVELPKLKCSFCERVFRNKSMLNGHVRRQHVKEKNHVCDRCPMSFYTSADLRRHKGVHDKRKVVTCDICSTINACAHDKFQYSKVEGVVCVIGVQVAGGECAKGSVGRDDEAITSTSTGSRRARGKNAQYYRDYRARKRAEQEKESLNRINDPSTTADSSTINVAGSVKAKKRKSAAEYQREYRARKKAKRNNILIDSLPAVPSTSTGGFTITHQSTRVDRLTTAGPSINPPMTAGLSTNSDIGFAKPTRRKTPAEYQQEYRARKKAQRESTRAAKTKNDSWRLLMKMPAILVTTIQR
ncbi:Zinc finger protein 62 homolog [Eumeta japonica]|uniref:Zinc finger protein 62 homolog n=1 Tax=Eumeta variegata TaxID=151549 RepID=A0A4C1VVE3_EUMVA|nr:Zinc finger protein 62 homolog [Eumeta japonica]